MEESKKSGESLLDGALHLAMTTALRLAAKGPEEGDLEEHRFSPLPEISLDQVSWHDRCDDCWIVLYDGVYNVTDFLREHPGGADVLAEYAGRDATLAYRGFGHSALAWQMLQRYLVGVLPEEERTRIFKEKPVSRNLQLRAASS